MKKILILALLSLTALACDDSEELTCEVLTSPDFCWQTAVTEAYACTADVTMGDCEMAADNLSCAYPDSNISATFQPALDPDAFIGMDEVDATVNVDGTQCARFVDSDDSMQLTTASGTVLITNGSTYSIECQDGTVYATSKPFDLLSCGDGNLFASPLPGSFKSGSGRYWSLGPSPMPEGASSWLSLIFPE